MVGNIELLSNLNAVTPGGFSGATLADPKVFAEALARHGGSGAAAAPALQFALYNPGAQPRTDLTSIAVKGSDRKNRQELSEERKARLDQFVRGNATATLAGKNVSDALNGDSPLKHLTLSEKVYLIVQAAEKWQANGDSEAIQQAAKNLKSPETHAIVSTAYAAPLAETLKIHAYDMKTLSTPQSNNARYEMLRAAVNIDKESALRAFERVEPGLGRVILQRSEDGKPGWRVASKEIREDGFVLRHP